MIKWLKNLHPSPLLLDFFCKSCAKCNRSFFFHLSESKGVYISRQQHVNLKLKLNPAVIVEDKAFTRVGEG